MVRHHVVWQLIHNNRCLIICVARVKNTPWPFERKSLTYGRDNFCLRLSKCVFWVGFEHFDGNFRDQALQFWTQLYIHRPEIVIHVANCGKYGLPPSINFLRNRPRPLSVV